MIVRHAAVIIGGASFSGGEVHSRHVIGLDDHDL